MVDEAQSFHGTTPGLWCSSRVMDLSRDEELSRDHALTLKQR